LGAILRVRKYQEKCGFAIEFSGLAFVPFFKTRRESVVLKLREGPGDGAAPNPGLHPKDQDRRDEEKEKILAWADWGQLKTGR
jgi:hypothetical protein